MKSAIKIFALGVALAASATMAKADPVLGYGQIQVFVNACYSTSGASCNATKTNAEGLLFQGQPTAVTGKGTLDMFNTPDVTFTGSSSYVPYAFPTNTELFKVTDTAAGPDDGDYLIFTTGNHAGQSEISVGGETVDFYDTGTLVLYNSLGDVIGSSQSFVTANQTTPNSGYQFSIGAITSPTPEPSSLILLGSGLLGAAGIARRRFSKQSA